MGSSRLMACSMPRWRISADSPQRNPRGSESVGSSRARFLRTRGLRRHRCADPAHVRCAPGPAGRREIRQATEAALPAAPPAAGNHAWRADGHRHHLAFRLALLAALEHRRRQPAMPPRQPAAPRGRTVPLWNQNPKAWTTPERQRKPPPELTQVGPLPCEHWQHEAARRPSLMPSCEHGLTLHSGSTPQMPGRSGAATAEYRSPVFKCYPGKSRPRITCCRGGTAATRGREPSGS